MLLRAFVRFLLTIALIWVLRTFFGDYFVMTGDVLAYIVVALLITAMNIVIAPVLNALTLPLRIFTSVLASIVANGLFLSLTVWLVETIDPAIVTLRIRGGIIGWLVVIIVLGLAKWLMRLILK